MDRTSLLWRSFARHLAIEFIHSIHIYVHTKAVVRVNFPVVIRIYDSIYQNRFIMSTFLGHILVLYDDDG